MSIAKLVNGRVFPAPADQSLLDAAQAAGVVLPYGCRTGRCSTCKARVISGRTQATVDEVGLSPSEVLDGWILTCVRTALTDVELDADQLGGVGGAHTYVPVLSRTDQTWLGAQGHV